MEINPQRSQTQSRLCSLPAEIRAIIFAFALSADDDQSKPYRPDRKYYRPGYHFHQKINISLLLTCKQVYSEARLLPVSANEHVFWLFNGPWKYINPNSRNTARWDTWYFRLNEDQKNAISRVHIFTQQAYLERLITTDARRFPCKTRSLHLTFRNADWWSWESPPASSDRLGICPWRLDRTACQDMLSEPNKPTLHYIKEHMVDGTWGAAVCQILNLRELLLEFEIDERKKSQLQAVVERAKAWRFPLAREDYVLEWDGQLKEFSWGGLRDLMDDPHFAHFPRESSELGDKPKRAYCVVKMRWSSKRVRSSPAS
jgi:hypothetical protein